MAEQGVLLEGASWTCTLAALQNTSHMPKRHPLKERDKMETISLKSHCTKDSSDPVLLQKEWAVQWL